MSAGRWLAWVVLVGAALALVAIPLVRLFSSAAGGGPVALERAFGEDGRTAVLNTLWVGAAATAIAVGLGTAAAFLTERTFIAGRGWLRLGLLAPLLVPGFVVAASWQRAYGPAGLSDRLLGVEFPGLLGPAGIVALLAAEGLPLAYLIMAATLATRVEPDVERAARASGAGRWQTLVTVSLPLLRPALAAAAALVFVRTINAFGVPIVLGTPAGFSTITTRLYRDLAFAADPAAFDRVLVLASLLVVVALLASIGGESLAGADGPSRTGLPPGPVIVRRAGGLARAGAVVAWLGVGLVLVVPLAALVLGALTRAVGLPPLPENWSLANFERALTPRAAGALANSLVLASLAATAALLLGGLLAALGRGGRRRWTTRPLGIIVLISFAVPGSAIAISVLLAYGALLRDTLAIILVAYLAKFWAIGHRPLAGAIERLPLDLWRAARVSGARPTTAFRSVVIPVLLPVIVGAWALVFLFGLHELTMSSLLYGPGTATLAVVVLNLQQLGDPNLTAALAVILIGLLLLAAAPLLLARGALERLAGWR